MNPSVAHLALVIVAIGAAAFVAFMIFAVLVAGCRTQPPPEPPYVETVAASLRDR